MKIMFLSHITDQSGASIALLEELKVIKQKTPDIEAVILTLKGGALEGHFQKLFPIINIEFRPTLFNRIIRRLGIERHSIKRLISKNKFDCIYANTVATFKIGIQIKHIINVPLIGHVHEAESLMRMFKITNSQLAEFDKIITVSEFAKKNLIENYAVSKEKIMIQHPISLWMKKAIEANTEFNYIQKEKNEFTIGLFCYGDWQKSLEILPFVIKSLYDKYPSINCKFMVVGYLNESRYHTEFDLNKMGLQDKVEWVERNEKPLCYHNLFDIFLLLSREESFSLAAEEAAFTGTPIIGFEEATGAAEWIKDGAGLLVPYMDIEALADAIYQLYSDTELRQSLGKNGKKIVTKLYENDSKMENVLNAIMNVKQ